MLEYIRYLRELAWAEYHYLKISRRRRSWPSLKEFLLWLVAVEPPNNFKPSDYRSVVAEQGGIKVQIERRQRPNVNDYYRGVADYLAKHPECHFLERE